MFFAQQALAINYIFSDSGVAPILTGCSRTGVGTYSCISPVILTGNDSINITGSVPATITFNSNLSLQWINDSTTAKINNAGTASNLNLVINGTLSAAKLTVIKANIQANTVSNAGTNVTYGGSISTTTGGISLGNTSTVAGAISSTSGTITLDGNDMLSSSVNCTTCTLYVYNSGNSINGAISVNYLDDSSTSSTYQGNITATSTSGKAAFIYIGTSSTVTGNVNAYSSFANNAQVRLRSGATVTGNVGAYASGGSSVTDAYVYLDSASTVNGNVTANSTGSNQFTRVEKYSNATVNGSISAIAASPTYATVFLYAGTVSGSVTSSDNIYNYANIGGCAQSTESKPIYLYTSSSAGAVCCGGSGSCANGCVNPSSGVSMPPLCSFPAIKIAEYKLDESAWTGNTNETKDTAAYSGGPFDGQGVGTPKPTAASSNAAKTGTVGTCGYATFSGTAPADSAFTLDSLPVSINNGAKTSVSFWMYWDGTDNQMPLGWHAYDLWFYNGKFGFNTNNLDIYGINSSGLANGWHHVVAVFTNGGVTTNKLYIDGISVALSQQIGSPTNVKAVVNATLNISGFGVSNAFKFTGGRIDEVKVYNSEMTQAQVSADYTATHACTGMPNLLAYYHFEESTWTTAAGQVIDASGNNYHASVGKSSDSQRAQTEDSLTNRFIASSPGTCGYSVFGNNNATQGPIVLPASMPNLTGSFTFAAWYNELSSSATARRIFADDYNESPGGFVFSANDGGTGKLRFARRAATGGASISIDTPAIISAGTKYFIAVSVNAVNQTATIYVYDTSGTLLNQTTGTMDYFGGSNTGNMTIGGVQSASGNQYLSHSRMDEVSIYNSALTQAQILALLQTNHNCAGTNVAAANFNCVVTGGASDNGRLYTQLSNTGFNVDVVALKSDLTTETSFVTSGTKNLTLDWISGANNTCTTGTILTPATTVTFSTTDNGRKAVSIPAFNKAYRNLRCRITDANQSPTVTGCSSDNFAVRPPGDFSVTSSNAIADSTNTGSNRNESATPTFIAASTNFNLTASTNTVGYDGTPIIKTPTGTNEEDVYSWANGAAPLSSDNYSNPATFYRVVGSVTGSFSPANAATGNAVGNTFLYSEVGYFRLQANAIIDTDFTSVDQPNDCNLDYVAGGGKNACYIGHNSRTPFFGRFIPDHFTITSTSTTPGCSLGATPFTYYGQDAFITTFDIEARNAANQLTQNYTNNAANEGENYAKLNVNNSASFSFLPSSGTLENTVITSTGDWVQGKVSVAAKHKFSRPSTPLPAADITISIKPQDSDGVTLSRTIITDTTKDLFRYGRLSIANTYGSELLPLSIPIEAQYWNGSAYLRNQFDACTIINPSNISMGNYKNNLAACETQLSGAGSMVQGKTTAKLSKPGNGNHGSVDLTVNLANVGSSPNDKSCISSTETNATATGYAWFGASNPAARATFGIFKSPIIYMRENY